MTPEELLKKGLNQIGFSYSEGQINAFMTFLFELKKWNRAYNLTALKSDKDIIIKHFLDSALYLKAIPERPVGKREQGLFADGINSLNVADVGTGAGFPGIPMKIMRPDLDITLIEPSRKKTAFLRHIIRVLKLDGISIIDKRIEALGKTHKKTYDVIVSRATFKIKDFIKIACPCVKEKGRLVLSKGPRFSKEIKGLKNKSLVKKIVKLPYTGSERNLIIFEKPPS